MHGISNPTWMVDVHGGLVQVHIQLSQTSYGLAPLSWCLHICPLRSVKCLKSREKLHLKLIQSRAPKPSQPPFLRCKLLVSGESKFCLVNNERSDAQQGFIMKISSTCMIVEVNQMVIVLKIVSTTDLQMFYQSSFNIQALAIQITVSRMFFWNPRQPVVTTPQKSRPFWIPCIFLSAFPVEGRMSGAEMLEGLTGVVKKTLVLSVLFLGRWFGIWI